MDIAEIQDKVKIEKFLRKDSYLHLYEVGNMQEKLFKNTKWFALENNNDITALAMLYTASNVNVFYLLDNTAQADSSKLLKEILPRLPQKMYCLISAHLVDVIGTKFNFEKTVAYDKMKLLGDLILGKKIKYPEYTYRINANDTETVNEFLKSINPNAFFNSGMLKTGKYFCIRKNASLLATAGVHLYSKEYSMAAVGNVATLAEERGKGYATSVTASLCEDLWRDVKTVGLNVRADNITAIKIYENLGFIKHTTHMELTAVKK